MGLLQVKLLLFLLLLSICPKISVQIPTCSNNTFFIQYPFKLLQEGQNPHHISSYDLRCNTKGLVVLNLPFSGEFYVRNIDYFEQKIQLYDPGNCLPGRLRNLSLSYSPFVAISYQNYTFFSCPHESSSSRNLTAIDCLSNSTASVVAASVVSRTDEDRNMTGCKVIYSLQTPVSQVYNGIDSDLQLSWNDPKSRGDRRGKPGVLTIILICAITISTALLVAVFCIGCGLSVVVVMLDIEEVNTQRLWSYSTRPWKMARIKLSSPRQQSETSAPTQAAGPFDEVSFMASVQPSALRVAAVAVASTLGESSPAPSSPNVAAEPLHDFFPFTPLPQVRRGGAASIDGLSSTPSSPSVAADHHDDDFLFMYPNEVPGMAAADLDEFSFMTPLPAESDDEFFFNATPDDGLPTEDLIIGGNQCILGPNGDSCSICLGEYKATERLRLIRKCNHCFHADCLEQWLQRKNTCPICRTDVI